MRGPGRAPRGGQRAAGRRALLSGAVVLYLGGLLVLPLASLLYTAGSLGAGALLGALVQPDALEAIGRSLLVAVLVVAINTAFGIAGALALVRHRFFGRRLLDALVDVPLALSPVMAGLALLLVYGRSGWAGPLLEPLGLNVAFALPGVVLATLFVTVPLSLREVGHVLLQAGTSEEDAAATLGAGEWQTFLWVTLPNVRDGVLYGVTMTAARALGEFGAVLVVGGAILGKTQTATTLIYSAVEQRRDATAYAVALLLVGVSALVLLSMRALRRRAGGAAR